MFLFLEIIPPPISIVNSFSPKSTTTKKWIRPLRVKHTSAESCKTLSATGSRILPKTEMQLNLLAINPSIISKREAPAKIIKAKIGERLKYAHTKTGHKAKRIKDKILGTYFIIKTSFFKTFAF